MIQVFMPKIDYKEKPSLIMIQQHKAYTEMLAAGTNVTVNYDVEVCCDHMIAEIEIWELFDYYKAKHNIQTNPKAMSDKLKSYRLYDQADFEQLPLMSFDKDSLQHFLNTPFIIKPKIGAGSVTYQNPFPYKVFENADQFSKSIKSDQNMQQLKHMFITKDYIIQQAITQPNKKYGQLYIEGFVNNKGEIAFSSIHEIEFLNHRWTHQLKWSEEDNEQRDQLIKKVCQLVYFNNIRNTFFQLQFLRDLNQRKSTWYPTDWQYRVAYNTLYGRMARERILMGQYVDFMTNQINRITIEPKYQYYQSYIQIDLNKPKQIVKQAIEKYDMLNVPFPKNNHDDQTKFLFVTHGETFEQAKEKTDEFSRLVA